MTTCNSSLSDTDEDYLYLPGEIFSPEDSKNEITFDQNKDRTNDSQVKITIPCYKVRLPIHHHHFCLMGNPSIYYPKIGDIVIGIITNVNPEGYFVEIRSSSNAYLSVPNLLKPSQLKNTISGNELVLARVTSTGPSYSTVTASDIINEYNGSHLKKNIQNKKNESMLYHNLILNELCEISCLNHCDLPIQNQYANYCGILPSENSYTFDIPIPVAISLQSNDCFILNRLGKLVKFEVAVGSNGRIWIRAEKLNITMFVSHSILGCIGKELPQMESIIKYLLKQYTIQVTDNTS